MSFLSALKKIPLPMVIGALAASGSLLPFTARAETFSFLSPTRLYFIQHGPASRQAGYEWTLNRLGREDLLKWYRAETMPAPEKARQQGELLKKSVKPQSFSFAVPDARGFEWRPDFEYDSRTCSYHVYRYLQAKGQPRTPARERALVTTLPPEADCGRSDYWTLKCRSVQMKYPSEFRETFSDLEDCRRTLPDFPETRRKECLAGKSAALQRFERDYARYLQELREHRAGQRGRAPAEPASPGVPRCFHRDM